MATSNGSTAIRDKILASLARYRALRIGKFPCAFWRLSSRPGLTAVVPNILVVIYFLGILHTFLSFLHPYLRYQHNNPPTKNDSPNTSLFASWETSGKLEWQSYLLLFRLKSGKRSLSGVMIFSPW
ncbi:hypothetical protein BPLS_P3473 [Bathymodiolus platifrons methanotrophic gill symbiont]|nr:hypothetical protein BPLS_P3473 [Bathymodiolus platifrons methanotrophic gill symbiont]